jgi:hypothetical protein
VSLPYETGGRSSVTVVQNFESYGSIQDHEYIQFPSYYTDDQFGIPGPCLSKTARHSMAEAAMSRSKL